MNKQIVDSRASFSDYLSVKAIDNPERWMSIVDFGLKVALQALGELRENQEVYDVTDLDRVNDWRDKMRSEPVWINLDRQHNGQLSKVLRLYSQFIENLDRLSQYSQGFKAAKPLANSQDTIEPEPGIKVSRAEQTILINSKVEEGEAVDIHTTRYERSRLARQLCIEAYGNTYRCEICGFRLSEKYGPRTHPEEYIEVHHIKKHTERSRKEGSHPVNYRTEMIPLCPNCHRMIHFLKDHTISPNELREIIKANERKN